MGHHQRRPHPVLSVTATHPGTDTRLDVLAPRLAAARDSFVASEVAWTHERCRLIGARADLERLVAHRELQVIRSESRRAARSNSKYMTWRQVKLDRARASLQRVVDALAVLEATPPGHYTFDSGQEDSPDA